MNTSFPSARYGEKAYLLRNEILLARCRTSVGETGGMERLVDTDFFDRLSGEGKGGGVL